MEGIRTIDPQSAPQGRLLDMAPDLLGAAGFDGLLRFVNRAWSATLGWPPDALVERSWLDLVHPEDRPEAEAFLARAAAGEDAGELTCRMPCADGQSERSVLWSGQGCVEDASVYLAGKDITERKRLEDDLAAHAEQLERTNADLQDFAYIASHDLAEPLRMITSYLELLQRRYDGQLDETADEFIGYAVGGAVRMRALIDDLLAYSRVGSHQLHRVEIELGDLLAAVLQGIERAVEEAGAQVELAQPLARVRGDATQVAQLLQNLLVNAVKFRAPDRPPRVVVSSVAEDGGVRISVADNGIGIAPDQQERIFKMFTRLHGRDEYDGTGIGLSLVRRIADRHGGRVWVEPDAGAGSTFHVWLPA